MNIETMDTNTEFMNTETMDLATTVNNLTKTVDLLNAKLTYYTKIMNEMDSKIYYLLQRNEIQQQYINSHARKINRIHKTIYQICGAVYDHNTEMDYVMNYMNYMIYNNHCCTHFIDEQDESDDDISDSDQ